MNSTIRLDNHIVRSTYQNMKKIQAEYEDTDLQNIKFIVHISDVHIRKRERHEEYRVVFDRLYEEVQKIIDEKGETLVVITGDTMHDKTELVPESIYFLKQFLIRLSDMTEVVLLVGNHDVNIFNIGSMNCLTPVVADLYTDRKIHLLEEDTVYLFGKNKIAFGVTTIWANRVTPIDDYELEDDVVKIALYHGMIHGCTLDNGMLALNDNRTTNSSYFNLSDFDGYDLALLGDVHKHQFLNADKTIAYAGSLIQQKRDEDLLEHGYILWDVSNLKGEFHPIKSDYGMIEMHVPDNTKAYAKLLNTKKTKARWVSAYPNSKLPPKLDVKLVYSSIQARDSFKQIYRSLTSHRQIVKTSEVLSTKSISIPNTLENFTFTSISKEDIEFGKNGTDGSTTAQKSTKTRKDSSTNHIETDHKLIKITGDESVVRVMLDHYDRSLKEQGQKADKKTRNLIRKEIVSLLKSINYNYDKDVKNIKLKSIEFDNSFIYLEGNRVDFTLFDKIVGLNAANYQGKSSFIDVILYAIYGRCSRGKRYDILNINKKKMKSRIALTVNGVEYTILRTSYVNSEKNRDLKESVSVWEVDQNITGDDRVKTHKVIESKICAYSDMINNSFVLQKNGQSFTDLTDRQKKDLLCKMAKLDIFDRVFQEAKSKHCSYSQSYGKLVRKLDPFMDTYLNREQIQEISTNNATNTARKLDLIEKSITSQLHKVDKRIRNVENRIKKMRQTLTKLARKESTLKTEALYIDQILRTLMNHQSIESEITKSSENLVGLISELESVQNSRQGLLEGGTTTLIALEQKLEQIYEDVQSKVRADRERLMELNYEMVKVDKTESEILGELADSRELLINKQDRSLQLIEEVKHLQNEQNRLEQLRDRDEIIKQRVEKIRTLEEESRSIRTEIEKKIERISEYESTLKNLANHEYNPECDKCMSNPVTQNILFYRGELKTCQDEVVGLKRKISENENRIQKLEVLKLDRKKVDCRAEYAECLERPSQIEGIKGLIASKTKDREVLGSEVELVRSNVRRGEKELEQFKTNIAKAEKIKRIQQRIESIESGEQSYLEGRIDRIKEYDRNLEGIGSNIDRELDQLSRLYEQMEPYILDDEDRIDIAELRLKMLESSTASDRVAKLENRIGVLKGELELKIRKLDRLVTEKNRLVIDKQRFEDINNSIDDDSNSKLVLGQIKTILDRSGLVDQILSNNIIPYLQTQINSILEGVGHYQIDIKYKNQSVNIYKANGLNVSMSSGYESYLLDLVFRLALVQVNNHIRTDFLIIDEGFNACDAEHKKNIRDLLEYMRDYYSWLLIISHDDFIKSFYDQNIQIESVKQIEGPFKQEIIGSKITNVKMDRSVGIEEMIDQIHEEQEHEHESRKKEIKRGIKKEIKKEVKKAKVKPKPKRMVRVIKNRQINKN